MAIAFDKSGSGTNGGATATVSLDAAATNELAVIFVKGPTAASFSNVTVDGVAATQIGSTFDWNSENTLAAYYFVNPPTSSVTYSATTSVADGINIFVQLYSGADIPNANNTGSDTGSTNITLSVVVPTNNSWLASQFLCTGSGANTNAGGAGTTVRQTIASNSSGDSNTAVGTGSQSMAWTGGRLRSSGFIVAIPPTGAAGATRDARMLTILGVG